MVNLTKRSKINVKMSGTNIKVRIPSVLESLVLFVEPKLTSSTVDLPNSDSMKMNIEFKINGYSFCNRLHGRAVRASKRLKLINKKLADYQKQNNK